MQEEARKLIAQGPPFDIGASGLQRHTVYLSAAEVVFVFEGREVEWIVDSMTRTPSSRSSPMPSRTGVPSWRPTSGSRARPSPGSRAEARTSVSRNLGVARDYRDVDRCSCDRRLGFGLLGIEQRWQRTTIPSDIFA